MRALTSMSVAVLCFAADQASKWWVLEGLELREKLRLEIAPFLTFVLAYNPGVNFGLFASESASRQYFFAGFALVVSLALLVWAARARDRRVAVGCGLVIGGALANALDRLREGAVIDFINLDCCGIGNPYAFNIADAAIFFGAVTLALFGFGDDEGGDRRERESARRRRRRRARGSGA